MHIIEILYRKTIGRVFDIINSVCKNYIEYVICVVWLIGFMIIKTIDNVLHSVYYVLGLAYTRDYSREDCRNSYPIVMVHGFLGCDNDSDSVLGLNYWNVINYKKRQNYDPYSKVYTVRLPPCASDEKRARYLAKIIDMFFYEQENGIHLIAHSQGASTVRFMINRMKPRVMRTTESGEPLDYRNYVKSIITINGSCKGSFLMDFFFKTDQENNFIRDRSTGKCIPKNSKITNFLVRMMRFYHKLTNVFPVLNTSFYDLKWGKSYLTYDEIEQNIKEELTKGVNSVDQIFGKYCDPALMEEYHNSKHFEHMEYIANSRDNYPCDSVLTCNNAEPMYTFSKNEICKCYDKIDGLHKLNDIECTCERQEDEIKYVHVIGNIESLKGIFAYFPKIYPDDVGPHDGVISCDSQSGYCGSERINKDKKIYLKIDTLSYETISGHRGVNSEILSPKKRRSEFKTMEVPNLDMLHCLARNKIKIVCIGMDGMGHADIIFPHFPFTYKRINNMFGNLIKYVRYINC